MKETGRYHESEVFSTSSEDSGIKKIDYDTEAVETYAEMHWPKKSAVRDILQNHLDAEREIYYEKLLDELVHKKAFNESLEKLNEHEKKQQIDKLHKFVYLLFYFHKFGAGFSSEAKTHYNSLISKEMSGLPIKNAWKKGDGLDLDLIRTELGFIHEQKPTIKILVKDPHTNNKAWIDSEDFKSKGFINGKDILAVEVKDSGKGYDWPFVGDFHSTKTGLKHLRGEFGEGGKLSSYRFKQAGTDVWKNSKTDYTDEKGKPKSKLWSVKYATGDKGNVKITGTEVNAPTQEMGNNSSTLINFKDTSSSFRLDTVKEFTNTPEDKKPILVDNSREFAYFSEVPVGVKFDEEKGSNLYVQDIFAQESSKRFGASYNIQDKSVLSVDRNKVETESYNLILKFWQSCDNENTFYKILDKLDQNHESNFIEFNAINNVFDNSRVPERVSKACTDAFVKLHNIENGGKCLIFEPGKFLYSSSNVFEKVEMLQKEFGFRKIDTRLQSEDIVSKIKKYHPDLEVYDLNSALIYGKNQKGEILESGDSELEIEENYKSNIENFLYTYFPEILEDLEISIEKKETRYGDDFDDDDDYQDDFYNSHTEKKFKRLKTISLKEEDYEYGEGVLKDKAEKEAFQIALDFYGKGKSFDLRFVSLQSRADYDLEVVFANLENGDDSFYKKFNNIASEEPQFEYDRKDYERLGEEQKLLAEIKNNPLVAVELNDRFNTLLPKTQQSLEKILKEFIYFDGTSVHFFAPTNRTDKKFDYITGSEYEFQSVESNGLKLYEIEKGWLTFWYARYVKEADVTVIGEKDKVFNWNGERYYQTEYNLVSIGESIFPNDVIKLGENGKREDFIEKLNNLKYYSRTDRETEFETSKPEFVKTSIEKNHRADGWGKDEDSGLKILLDCLQNHLHAAKGDSINVEFLFETEKGKVWLTQNQAEKIEGEYLGIRFTDTGKGFISDNIGLLGSTEKIHPKDPGQYGEGLKMIAAAGARIPWLDLSFKSTFKSKDQLISWQASPTTYKKPIIKGQQQIEAEYVGFNIEYPEPKSSTGSTTEIVFSGNPDQLKEWKNFVNKVKVNEGGMAKWIPDLKGKELRKFKSGLVEYYPNESGIFENGVLINKKPYELDSVVGGWSVPHVTVDRDRSDINNAKFYSYIIDSLAHADYDFAKEFLTRNFNENGTIKKESKDLLNSLGYYLNNSSSVPVNTTAWYKAYWELFPASVLISRGGITGELEKVSKGSEEYYNLGQALEFSKKLVDDSTDVSEAQYNILKKFLPTLPERLGRPVKMESKQAEEMRDFTVSILKQIKPDLDSWVESLMERVSRQESPTVSLAKMTGGVTRFKERLDSWYEQLDVEPNKKVKIVEKAFGILGSMQLYSGEMNISKQSFRPKTIFSFKATLAHELIHFISKESDYGEAFIMLLKDLESHLKTKSAT